MLQAIDTQGLSCDGVRGGLHAAVVGSTQRQLSSACRVVVMIAAVGLASPRGLPWLMFASAVIASIAAAVFAACAAAEWSNSNLDDISGDEALEDLAFLSVRKGPALQLAVMSDGNGYSTELTGLISPNDH